VVDHINRNPLDNRKCNLRHSTRTENARNRICINPNGYPGLEKSKSGKRYKVYITVFKKAHYLGSFSNLEDAINARKKAEIKYRGEVLSHL
jgi:hypothetical protein